MCYDISIREFSTRAVYLIDELFHPVQTLQSTRLFHLQLQSSSFVEPTSSVNRAYKKVMFLYTRSNIYLRIPEYYLAALNQLQLYNEKVPSVVAEKIVYYLFTFYV